MTFKDLYSQAKPIHPSTGEELTLLEALTILDEAGMLDLEESEAEGDSSG